jgi:DNA-binding response OmpR family regulator
VTYDRLILAVWQTTYVGRHTLDVHVGALRAKLDVPDLLQTVRGVGYRLTADG